jgi:hypothetical protein
MHCNGFCISLVCAAVRYMHCALFSANYHMQYYMHTLKYVPQVVAVVHTSRRHHPGLV